MFQFLTNNILKTLNKLRGIKNITENNISESLQEIKLSLLASDVNFKVTEEFIESVKNKSIGQNIISSITPGQLIVKIIQDELVKVLGSNHSDLSKNRPLKIMMVGLHGSGKTTTSAKLAFLLKKRGYNNTALVACDLHRPAAIDQLEILAKECNIKFYSEKDNDNVVQLATNSLKWSKENKCEAIIFDTAGRLQVNKNLITEIKLLADEIKPEEILFISDSALGQESVNIVKSFNSAINITGIILTKLDGDTKGGSALSMKAVTDIPIKFIGIGEKKTDLDLFHPERMAQRILGMGDIVSLVEKAKAVYNKEQEEVLSNNNLKNNFDFNSLLVQLNNFRKMGSINSIVSMLPNGTNLKIREQEEANILKIKFLIQSMTIQERKNPNIINASRRMRIAKGSGLLVKDVNQLIKQFNLIKKTIKSIKHNKKSKIKDKFNHLIGNNNLF